jgi:hypothetical protein
VRIETDAGVEGEAMTTTEFRELLSHVTTQLEGRPLNSNLEAYLNREFPAGSTVTQAIFDACRDAIAAGWLVYGPDSSHAPTVAGGTAFVLYLLPQGVIEFSQT